MADTMIGNILEVVAVGRQDPGVAITADGANTVTIAAADLPKIRVGDTIDIINKTTNAVLAAARQVTDLTSAGVLTYGGGDVVATPGTHVVVPPGYLIPLAAAQSNYINVNGGWDASHGAALPPVVRDNSIGAMKEYLLSLAKTAYTAASLNAMTYNDLVYACRQEAYPGSIK